MPVLCFRVCFSKARALGRFERIEEVEKKPQNGWGKHGGGGTRIDFGT